MAVILYKASQFQVCNEFSYLHHLDNGWFYTQEEALEADAKATEGEPIEPEPVLENDIRIAAKVAGISSWHTKGIDRLTKELGELEDAERSEN